jgi:hypothetical protein
MKITYKVVECRDKISPNCTKTFNLEVKRGRPQVNCDACKSAGKAVRPSGVVVTDSGPVLERTCPCGAKFTINPGRGRKATKCNKCREEGVVYRANDDGQLEAIQAATLAEEQREKAEQQGRERAANLMILMGPLLRKTDRVVIPH